MKSLFALFLLIVVPLQTPYPSGKTVLEKIDRNMSSENLVISQKGYGGGFRLAQTARKITLFDIVDPIEKISRWTGDIKAPEPVQGAPPTLYDAKCSMCGKDTKVVFQPDGKRPVYCKPCRKKMQESREEENNSPPPSVLSFSPPRRQRNEQPPFRPKRKEASGVG